MSDAASTPEEAKPIFLAMTPSDQAAVKSLISAGRDRVHAVNLVAAQTKAASVGAASHQADVLTGGPTASETATSYAEKLANTLGARASPVANGMAAAATYPMSPIEGFKQGYASQKANLAAADAQAPGAAGAGELTGDILNAPAAVMGGLGIKRALESAAASPIGIRVVGAARNALNPMNLVRDVAETKGLASGVAQRLRDSLGALIGNGGEVGDAAIEAVTDAASPFTLPVEPPPAPNELATRFARPPPPLYPSAKAVPDMPAPPAESPLDPLWKPRSAPTPMEQIPQPSPAPRLAVSAEPMVEGSPNASPEALDELARLRMANAPDMPADVMASAGPPKIAQAPVGMVGSGGADKLASQVQSLQPAARVPELRKIAQKYGVDVAKKVAKIANVSLKANPL